MSKSGCDEWCARELDPSYHFNRAECKNGVTTPAVGPGVPARILPLLKHILLPLTVGLLISHPSDSTEEKDRGLWLVQGHGEKDSYCNLLSTQVTLSVHFLLSIPYYSFIEPSLCLFFFSSLLCFCVCLWPHTHGPHSTSMEPTFSTPASWRLLQGAVSSWQRPWKFSCS